MNDVSAEVKRLSITGVRWSLALTVVLTPLSFLTNLLLGRVSAEALGCYGAISILLGSCFTLVAPGGAAVFTRFVPLLDKRDRMPFLLSYTAIALGVILVAAACAITLFEPWLDPLLGRFGGPSPALVLLLLVAVLVYCYSYYFLFGILQADRGAVTEKSVTLGFFVAVVLAFAAFPERLASDPGAYLWRAAGVIYGCSALLGVVFVAATEERRLSGGPRWMLPKGFWPVVGYTHLETVVAFVYSSLSPSIVLLWLDVGSLGHLHAAMRYVLLFNLLPVTIAAVTGPGMSTLAAQGLREEGLRQANAALRASLLILTPIAVGLVFFAGDAMALFGDVFYQHRDLLRILAVSLVAGPIVHGGGSVAVALGHFREYLRVSGLYVMVAIALTVILVPTLGVEGAALAMTIGALVRTVLVVVLLRRTVQAPRVERWLPAWGCALTAMVVARVVDPGRALGLGLTVGFILLFAAIGRVKPGEVTLLLRRALRRA